MSKEYSPTTTRNFKHLTPYQRGEIQTLLREGLPKTKIAQTIGIARSTLYAELERGTVTHWINNLPRKMLGYRTPKELFQEQLNHIASAA